MKYIQDHFKTKIELMERSYFGYLFEFKEFLENNEYDSNLYIVNTFSYLSWREIELIASGKKYVEDGEDYTVKQLQELCHTQLPDGNTILHMTANRETIITELLYRL